MNYKVDEQAAYVLHSRPYLETSALVDFFTLEQGRITAVVKGMRRPGSKLRGVLQPFIPLQVSLRGRQELKTLIQAESVGMNGILNGRALICGLYVNEMMQRLLSPYDAHPHLYVYYQYVLNELIAGHDIEGALRTFEHHLLAETGYGLALDLVSDQTVYYFDTENWRFKAVVNITETNRNRCFHGKDLLAIDQDCYDTPQLRQSAKRLMRLAIDHLLAGRPLHSRALFQKK
ncbi:DNA repair protein RecO [Neptunomonas antarctica]|uniref:DNA repair protein RecO n=1 Tax=Neptunomonas antarctica TaxID=619304 RepID=A0A1N7N062_9GAMM|nr:DNA repair protein RecO [Neptunomonas antarctica]SIS91725.1 DNA replication and repair protein RecO [Neptunomonas antarctica]